MTLSNVSIIFFIYHHANDITSINVIFLITNVLLQEFIVKEPLCTDLFHVVLENDGQQRYCFINITLCLCGSYDIT